MAARSPRRRRRACRACGAWRTFGHASGTRAGGRRIGPPPGGGRRAPRPPRAAAPALAADAARSPTTSRSTCSSSARWASRSARATPSSSSRTARSSTRSTRRSAARARPSTSPSSCGWERAIPPSGSGAPSSSGGGASPAASSSTGSARVKFDRSLEAPPARGRRRAPAPRPLARSLPRVPPAHLRLRRPHARTWAGSGSGRAGSATGSATDEWRDTAARVRGPIVGDLQRAFDHSWQNAGGRPAPRRTPTRACAAAGGPARRGRGLDARLGAHDARGADVLRPHRLGAPPALRRELLLRAGALAAEPARGAGARGASTCASSPPARTTTSRRCSPGSAAPTPACSRAACASGSTPPR